MHWLVVIPGPIDDVAVSSTGVALPAARVQAQLAAATEPQVRP